jgi:hypothetical protein
MLIAVFDLLFPGNNVPSIWLRSYLLFFLFSQWLLLSILGTTSITAYWRSWRSWR